MERDPCHAKKCACCLEGHGFFWANILCKFGLNCEVWRSKVHLYLAISSVSWLLRRKENIYVVQIFIFFCTIIIYKIGKEGFHYDFLYSLLPFTTSMASWRKGIAILH